jgi:SanA protein
MLRSSVLMILRILLALLIVLTASMLLPRLFLAVFTRRMTYSVEDAPTRRVAVVFGAGLWRDGRPTPVLRDRVATAASLYFAGKVEVLLMSGDNSRVNYNEPAAMRQFAIELGVPPEAITLDYAGRRTYDTCYRAREIFGLTDAILVTQSFHLPRALYTCNKLGVDAVGVPADRRDYRPFALFFWNLREAPASLVALWEVNVSRPQPVLGDPEPIFPLEAH